MVSKQILKKIRRIRFLCYKCQYVYERIDIYGVLGICLLVSYIFTVEASQLQRWIIMTDGEEKLSLELSLCWSSIIYKRSPTKYLQRSKLQSFCNEKCHLRFILLKLFRETIINIVSNISWRYSPCLL